jgi:hypothetical protein
MEQHVEAIREWKDGKSITALSEVYGVSRKTIHKWIEREASGYGSPTWRGDDFRESVGNVELGIDAKPVSGL